MNLCGMTACKTFNQWLQWGQQQREHEDKLQLAVQVRTCDSLSDVDVSKSICPTS